MVPAQPILSYVVQISSNASFGNLSGNVTVLSSQAASFSYTFSNLTKGTLYYGRARAITAIGSGAVSNASASQVAVGLPMPPGITNVTSGSDAVSPHLTVSWTQPSDSGAGGTFQVPLTFLVEISNTSSFAAVLLSQLSGNTSGLSLKVASSALQRGTVYYARVWSINAVGRSSNASGMVRKLLVGAPGAPTGLSLVVSGPLQLRLSWSAPADLGLGPGVSYPVSYLALISTNGSRPVNVTTSATAVAVPGVIIKGLTYNATVFTLNDADTPTSQPSSPAVSVAVDVSGPPSSATLCAYNASIFVSPGSCSVPAGALGLRLTWSKPLDSGAGAGVVSSTSAVLSYQALIFSSASFSTVLAATNVSAASTANFSYVFTGLSRDTTYWCRVRAMTVVGFGLNASTGGQVAVNVSSPPILTFFKSRTVSNNSFQLFLSWNQPIDTGAAAAAGVVVLAYKISISTDPSFQNVSSTFTEIFTVVPTPVTVGYIPQQASSVTYNTSTVVSKGTFYARVFAITAAGSSAGSNIISSLVTGFPGAPIKVLLALTGPLQLTLSWQAPTDLGAGAGVPYTQIMYQYYLWSWSGSQSLSFPSHVVGTDVSGGPNVTSVLFFDLLKGYFYKAAVRVVNLALQVPSLDGMGDGGGQWQQDMSTGIQSISSPGSVVSSLLLPWFNQSLQFLWSVPDCGSGSPSILLLNALGFQIQIFDKTPSNKIVDVNVSRNLTNYTTQSFSVGSYKLARVRASNIVGTGQWSNFTEATVVNVPGQMSNLSVLVNFASADGSISMILSFSPPLDTGLGLGSNSSIVTSYQIQTLPVKGTPSLVSCFQPMLVIASSSDRSKLISGLTKVCCFSNFFLSLGFCFQDVLLLPRAVGITFPYVLEMFWVMVFGATKYNTKRLVCLQSRKIRSQMQHTLCKWICAGRRRLTQEE